jgi:hypothetical protein
MNMKQSALAAALIAVLVFAFPLVAQQPSQPTSPPATQQQTGRVLGIATHTTHSTETYVNPQQGGADIGRVNADGSWKQRVTVIQVSNLVVESPQIHKEVEAGKDYPVIIETDKKGVAKKLTLTVDGKTYTYNIARTREPNSK